MAAWTRTESPHVLRALDCLFSQLGGKPDLETSPAMVVEGPAAVAVPLTDAQPPPKVETQADVQAAYEWLLRERKRLEAYTNAQMTRLQNEHGAMLARFYTNEQTMIVRAQELTNKEEFLTRQTRGLQQQGEKLAEREKALADQREQLCHAHSEFAELQKSCTGVRHDTEMQQALLRTLRAETEALQQDRERARQDLDVMERRLQEQTAAREREQALFAERQRQLDQRLSALDKAEEVAQQRLAELDDLEARLCQEMEAQEAQLAAERRTVEALAAQLRQRGMSEPRRPQTVRHSVP